VQFFCALRGKTAHSMIAGTLLPSILSCSPERRRRVSKGRQKSA